MITRSTVQGMLATAQRNLQTSLADLARLQEQASSRRQITRPSDDPSGTEDAMRVRTQQRLTEQFGRNIADGDGWLATVDSALSASTTILQRTRDLVVQGANDGSMSPTAKEAIALEIESLRDELLTQANATYLGRAVFAGTSDAGVAFRPDLTFTGTPGATVERRTTADATVRVDGDGAAVFGIGAGSAFALLDGIAADLRAGVNVGPRLAELDAVKTRVLGEHARVGARQAGLDRAKATIAERTVALEAQRASVEDVDLGRVILDLKLQETAYQSALAVTARALQPSLLEFLA